jgi:hypothetical protein
VQLDSPGQTDKITNEEENEAAFVYPKTFVEYEFP